MSGSAEIRREGRGGGETLILSEMVNTRQEGCKMLL